MEATETTTTGATAAVTAVAAKDKSVTALVINYLRNLLSGSIAGFAAKIVEYPFDTVKVLLQTQGDTYKGVFDCFRTVIRQHGFLGLYRGLTAPLVGSVIENAVLFSSFHTTRDVLPETVPHFAKIVAGGLAAGFGGAMVLTPIELIKCKLQVENAVEAKFKGPYDCLKQTLKHEGLPGLFRGLTATLLRELPGNVAWFGVYEGLSDAMVPVGGTRDDVPGWKSAIAGGFSGMAYWTAFYPAYTVKSQMQTDPKAANKSFVEVFRHITRTQGFRGLYKGWGITVSRAMPSNAVLFLTYELVAKRLRPQAEVK